MKAVLKKERRPEAMAEGKCFTGPAKRMAMERSEKMMEEIHVRATSVGGVLEGILQNTREHIRY